MLNNIFKKWVLEIVTEHLKNNKGEKGENSSCSLLEQNTPAIIDNRNGIERLLNHIYNESEIDKYSPAYANTTYYGNAILNRYINESVDNAFKHFKLVILNVTDETVIYVPEYESYKEIFAQFRKYPGNVNIGVDIALTLTVMRKLVKMIPGKPPSEVLFSLYFFPDAAQIIKPKYSKIELLESRIENLNFRLDYLEDVVKQITYRDGI